MNKDSWIEARENLLMERVNSLEAKLNRCLEQWEIDAIEDSLTENDIVNEYSAMVDYTFELLRG